VLLSEDPVPTELTVNVPFPVKVCILKLPLVVSVPPVAEIYVMAGVTLLDAALGALVPMALVAVTVKVYAVPVVSPVTVMGDAPPVPVIPPGLDVAV
jgi:hypothetical protein